MHLLVDEARAPLAGGIDVPRSKYHAHRALILASQARGTTRIVGASGARHVGSTIEMLRALGTEIELDAGGFVVHGGPYRPYRPSASVGSSGTTLYFMIGLAALADRPFTLTGQKYFQRRPVGPLLEALTRLGIRLQADEARPPITVSPSRPTGGHVQIAGTLSQWISGLLLVAPFATGPTVIEVEGALNEQPYIELTVRMMRDFGLVVDVADDWRRFEIAPGQEARPTTIELPPDIGSAAFGLAAAALHPSDVLFRGLTQTRSAEVDHPEAHFLDVVARMGLPMEIEPDGVRVRHDGLALRGTDIDCRPMPDMLPILATLGAFAEGATTFDNVGHVRLKESDRVVAMTQLNRMGGSVTLDGDQLVVRGVERLEGAPLSSFNDHRILMSLAVAGSRATGTTSLTYANAHRISYPTFIEDLTGIGLSLHVDRRTGTSRRRASVAIDQAAQVPLSQWVRRWAGERPTGTAIVDVRADGTRAWSWRALDEAADRTASLLLALGVRPGEPVAYQLPNWGEFVVLSLAVLRIGAVCCPLMPIFRRRELEFMLRRSQARVMIVPERFRGREHAAEVHELITHVGDLALEHVLVLRPDMTAATLPDHDHDRVQWHDYAAAVRRQPVDAAAIAARLAPPDATAQLLFTSGTTGEPKGVLHRNDALTRAATMEIEHLGLGRDDRLFIPSPLAHQTGFLYGMWNALVLGAGQILQDTWDPKLAVQALHEWGGSFVQAATPFLTDLVRAVEEGEPAPSALRIFVVTGAAVPRALAERATSVLDTAVCGAWGSTESCLGTLAAPTDPLDKRWGTDGRALPGTAIRVVDDAGVQLPPGVEGHFEVRSDTLFEGYLDRPDLTADALTSDGWYRSGDLATIDADGYLRITGRVTDVVNRGGEKVPVAEIEQLLHRHPAIADVAIVAMPDERLGERACAFLVLAGDTPVDLPALQRYLDELEVAKQYWPERVELIDALPRNAVGKIQKYVLRDRAGELAAQPA